METFIRDVIFTEFKKLNASEAIKQNSRLTKIIKGVFIAYFGVMTGLVGIMTDLFPLFVSFPNPATVPLISISGCFIVTMGVCLYLFLKLEKTSTNMIKNAVDFQEKCNELTGVVDTLQRQIQLLEKDRKLRIEMVRSIVNNSFHHIISSYYIIKDNKLGTSQDIYVQGEYKRNLVEILNWARDIFGILTGEGCSIVIKKLKNSSTTLDDIENISVEYHVCDSSTGSSQNGKKTSHKIHQDSLMKQLIQNMSFQTIFENDLSNPLHGEYHNDHTKDWKNQYSALFIASLNYSDQSLARDELQYFQGFLWLHCKPKNSGNKVFTEDVVNLLHVVANMCYLIIGINSEGRRVYNENRVSNK